MQRAHAGPALCIRTTGQTMVPYVQRLCRESPSLITVITKHVESLINIREWVVSNRVG